MYQIFERKEISQIIFRDSELPLDEKMFHQNKIKLRPLYNKAGIK